MLSLARLLTDPANVAALGWLAAFVCAGALTVVAALLKGRLGDRLPDLVAAPLLGGIAIVGLGLGALVDGQWKAAGLLAAAVAALWCLVAPTDLVPLPRGLRALWAAMVVVAVGGGRPPVETIKLPFTSRFVELGLLGWVVSWLWVWLYGSLFARAGTFPAVVPGLASIGAVVFWIVGILQPHVVDLAVRTAAMLCSAAGAAVALGHGAIHDGRRTSGSFAVGGFLGSIAALGMLKNTAMLALLVPLLAIGMPLFAAVVPRGHRLGRGAPAHLHEVLHRQGYTPRQIAAVELAGAAYLGMLAVLLVAVVEWHWAAKLALSAVWIAGGYAVGKLVLNVLPRRRQSPVELRLFGVRLHALTMDEALELARGFLRCGQPHYIVTCDASALNRALDDAHFREVVNAADLVTADGAGVVLAARLLGLPVNVRVPGCDLVEGLCRVAAEEGRSVYFLGAEPGVAEEAARKLAERIPGLVVAGCRDGYYPPEREDEVVEQISAARPGVLFVALGQPRQEFFIARHLRRIGAGVAIGIGGSLDVISGRKRRAPVWMQRAGLEWLYRVAKEPWRLPRLRALPRVVFRAAAAALRAPMLPTEGDEQL